MKSLCRVSMMTLVLTLLSAPALSQEKYLFEILQDRQHRSAWDGLVDSQKNAPDWLVRYGKTKDGPATPTESVTINGRDYPVNMVCKTHDCGNNRFYVIFSQDGKRAWGHLIVDGERETLFGSPDEDMMSALRTAE